MSFFYSLTFFVLTLGILYLVLNHRFSKLLDQKFDELYSKKVRADMQEFYREMETYSLIFDNKIKSFKNLIEKQQEQLLHWQEIINVLKKSKNGKELAQFISRARKKDEQMMQILTQMSALSQNSLQKVDEKIKAPAITNEGEEIPARQSPSNASLNKAHKAIEAMAQNTPTELPEKVRTSTTTSTLGTASIGSRSADPKKRSSPKCS